LTQRLAAGHFDGMTILKTTGCGKQVALGLLCFLALPLTAGAHSADGVAGGFASGFTHPLTGLDHIVAMVAVGLWGAFLGRQAMWTLPVVFPVVMALGGALGVLGVPLPGVETGIAASGVILGAMVAFAARPPLWVAAVLVGFFAVFHGIEAEFFAAKRGIIHFRLQFCQVQRIHFCGKMTPEFGATSGHQSIWEI
jgi:hydrogenase/urease accessory protein HupE